MNTDALLQAKLSYKKADHLLTQTFPQLKDPKLLLTALEHAFLASASAMTALIEHEQQYKRLPVCKDTFDGRFSLLLQHHDQYHLPRERLFAVKEMHTLLQHHKKSPVVFSKKETLFIADDSFHLTPVTQQQIKRYLSTVALLLQTAERANQ
ncbi:hypothetical protein HZB02_02870 [Candidatus Woesearchaeota archaeon]|nr:hypothetical protein [Candidatus Woesearchaeota archaeon]